MASTHGSARLEHASIEYDLTAGYTETVTTAGTPVVMSATAFASGPVDSEGMFTVAATSGTITCNFAGTVTAQAFVSAKPGTDADTLIFTITNGGTSVGVSGRITIPTVANTLQSTALGAHIEVSKGDVLDVRMDSNNDSDTATISGFSFIVLGLERL